MVSDQTKNGGFSVFILLMYGNVLRIIVNLNWVNLSNSEWVLLTIAFSLYRSGMMLTTSPAFWNCSYENYQKVLLLQVILKAVFISFADSFTSCNYFHYFTNWFLSSFNVAVKPVFNLLSRLFNSPRLS